MAKSRNHVLMDVADHLYRVLLAEDSDFDATLLEAQLRAAAGDTFLIERVRSVADLETAAAQGSFPHAMILDLGMPDSDGMDTFLRASAAMPDTAILVLTGTDDSGLALAAVAAGAQDYLVKGTMDGPGLAKALSFAIERKALDRHARAGEAAIGIRRRVISVSQLAAGTAAELQPAIELGVENSLKAGKAIAALQEALSASLNTVNPPSSSAAGSAASAASVMTAQADAAQAMKGVLDSLSLIQETARSLRLLGASAATEKTLVDLHRILRRVLVLNDSGWRSHAKLRTRIGFDTPYVLCDAQALESTVTSVIQNAIEALLRTDRSDGLITISTGCHGAWVWLRISDNGPGIAPELRPRLFEAFNSSKPLGTGGIGLARARVAIESAGGHITIEHREPGTDVTITLPMSG